MSDEPTNEPVSDAEIDAALATALRARALDSGAQERVRAVVFDEWQAAVAMTEAPATPSRWQASARWAAVACVAALIAVTALVWREPGAAAIGTVSRLGDGAIDAQWALIRHRSLQPRDALRVGDEISAAGPVLVALEEGGTLRIAGGSRLRVIDARGLSLEHGLIYVDTPPGAPGANALRVITRAGVVEHVGTQFEVLGIDRTVRVRVREGAVVVHGAGGDFRAMQGTEVVIPASGAPAFSATDTYGRDWLWVAALAPDYALEGRSLADFLGWVSRESGRHLEYADGHARDVAHRTILHGSVTGQEPSDALANVLATTSLAYEIRGETIRVHSGQ